MRNLIDLTDKRFGIWTVIKKDNKNINNRPAWLCRCDCGNYRTVRGGNLRSGQSKSCGCIRKNKIIVRNKQTIRCGKEHPGYKHGRTGTPEYNRERAMCRFILRLNRTNSSLTDNEKRKINLYYSISQLLGLEWQIDHIIPLSKGGPHHPDNLQIVTKKYNLQKKNRIDFRPPRVSEYFGIGDPR